MKNKNSSYPQVTAILQARTGSTRLPGKVLKEVMERPLLSYQIERMRLCKTIDNLVIATTTFKEDDSIAHLATKEGVEVYRGSDDDVLDRYYQAARFFGAEHIMRVTGDCPLLQPDICDDVVRKYFYAEAEYAHTGKSFAEGLDCEVFNLKLLTEAWQNAELLSEREHVTQYFHNNSESYKFLTVENSSDDSRYRITVDEEVDFRVVKAIIEALYSNQNSYITFVDIKNFLKDHPQLFFLNSHIVRNEGLIKSLQKEGNSSLKKT